MADAFLGLRMTVVMINPPVTVAGLITKVIPHQLLVLEQCRDLTPGSFGQEFPRIEIDPTNIRDIWESRDEAPPSFVAPPKPAAAVVAAPAAPSPSSSAFQDPAILSVGKRPPLNPQTIGERRDSVRVLSSTTNRPAPTRERDSAKRLDEGLGKMHISVPGPAEAVSKFDTTEDESFDATPTTSTAQAGHGAKAGPSSQVDGEQDGIKQPRRRQRAKQRQKTQNGEGTTPVSAKPTPTEQGGAGWRNTPILQSTKSFQPFSSLRKSQKPNADNGWASEDVTDVQEAGDFDFEGSLAKFDKRTIFDEMRQHDQVDESDRLVSHNRLPRPKPGTAGGKNFHYTENVLEVPSGSSSAVPKLKETPDDFWKSEADDGTINGADRLSGKEGGSGRNSRLRGESRMSTTRRSQSRKASATAQTVLEKQPVASTGAADGFYALPSNRRIETVTHLQMLNLENIAHNEIGFSEDLIAENAGRSISEVALTALNDPAVVLRYATASPPFVNTIVVLAGNHKSGARAIAAGRHLRNRGVEVVVCFVGIERERELVDEVQRQIRLFRSFGGQVYSKAQLFKHLNKTTTTLTSSSQVPVTLIMDALLGLSISFEELRKSDQATTYELMEWANRNEAFIMAIDIPSGIDPTTGKVSVIDGAKLYVHPRYIIALGAPKQGLLKAMEIGQDLDQGDITVDDWKLYLADIGLGTTIWRKAATNLKLRRGIVFDDKWVLEMRYRFQEQLSG